MPRSMIWVCFAAALTFAGCEKSAAPRADAPDAGPTTKPAAHSAAAAPAPGQAARVVNTKCPVSGDAIDPADPKLIVVNYKGKAYGLCCDDCEPDFKAHPEKYVKAE